MPLYIAHIKQVRTRPNGHCDTRSFGIADYNSIQFNFIYR